MFNSQSWHNPICSKIKYIFSVYWNFSQWLCALRCSSSLKRRGRKWCLETVYAKLRLSRQSLGRIFNQAAWEAVRGGGRRRRGGGAAVRRARARRRPLHSPPCRAPAAPRQLPPAFTPRATPTSELTRSHSRNWISSTNPPPTWTITLTSVSLVI